MATLAPTQPMFHGAPFHRLGVEHALGSCEDFHGAEGRQDLIGYAFSGDVALDADTLLDILGAAETPEFNHNTDGYPTFTDWPNSYAHATHQMQYYVWLQRAYLSGLRLVVQHATTNSVLCELMVGLGTQKTRYSCNDMRQDSPTADATAQGPTGEPPTPARPRDPDSIRAELERANAELSRRQKQLEQTLDELQATNERLNEEMQKRQHAETELRIAHKLEAVGRLAAGIAHEINTPTHFIGHNITFLSEAYGDLRELVSAFEDLLVATESCTGCAAARSDGKAAVDDADLDFLDGEVPVAFDAVRDGIGTISRIVGAMIVDDLLPY